MFLSFFISFCLKLRPYRIQHMYFLFQRQSHKNAQLRTMQKASAAFLENCQLQLVTVRHIIYRLLVFGRNPLFAAVPAESVLAFWLQMRCCLDALFWFRAVHEPAVNIR